MARAGGAAVGNLQLRALKPVGSMLQLYARCISGRQRWNFRGPRAPFMVATYAIVSGKCWQVFRVTGVYQVTLLSLGVRTSAMVSQVCPVELNQTS